MLVQEIHTDLAPAEVIRLARDFFSTRFSPHAAFAEGESDSHIKFEIEAGEVVIGTGMDEDGRTFVRGSTSRLHNELSQFLASLDVPEEVRDNSGEGPGVSGAG
jgi:hypothetical protein